MQTQHNENTVDADDVFYTLQVEPLLVYSAEINLETQRERILSHVCEQVKNGRNSNDPVEPVYKAFYNTRNELSINRVVLKWGIRVIIPVKFLAVLDLLHMGHPGIVHTKALASFCLLARH